MDNTGYSYTVDDDMIKEYMKFTTGEKPAWLHEIVQLNDMVIT